MELVFTLTLLVTAMACYATTASKRLADFGACRYQQETYHPYKTRAEYARHLLQRACVV